METVVANDLQVKAWMAFQQLRVSLLPPLIKNLNDNCGVSEAEYQVLIGIYSTPEDGIRPTDLAKKIDPQFDLKKATPADLARILPHITRDLQPYFAAAIHNHDITQSALKILVSSDPSAAQLGQLMTRHHHQLSKCLKVSHPKIDELIDLGYNKLDTNTKDFMDAIKMLARNMFTFQK